MYHSYIIRYYFQQSLVNRYSKIDVHNIFRKNPNIYYIYVLCSIYSLYIIITSLRYPCIAWHVDCPRKFTAREKLIYSSFISIRHSIEIWVIRSVPIQCFLYRFTCQRVYCRPDFKCKGSEGLCEVDYKTMLCTMADAYAVTYPRANIL